MVTNSVVVRFRGERAVEGPMTLGQLNAHKWLSWTSTPEYGMQYWRLPADAGGFAVTDFAEVLAVLLARHEGLRTTFPGGGRQRVVDSGELDLRVLAWEDGADPGELDRVVDAVPYDWAADLPVSAAVAVRSGRVCGAVLRCSHLAADHKGMVVLGREVEQMLADPAARVVGPPRHQPVDQAESERRPSTRRRAEGALDYWAGRLRRMPANPLAAPPGPGPAESRAMEMVSHAGAAALSRIERRTSLDRSNIVLAAVLSVLAERTGERDHLFCALSNNRFFDRRLSDHVGTLAASSLVEVDGRGATFDELGERVRSGMVRASMSAMYDAHRLHAIAEQVEHERGVAFHYFPPIFNNAAAYIRSHPAPHARPTPPTEFTWRRMERTPAPLRFDLWRLDSVLAMDAWTADTSRIGRPEVESTLRAVERLLVAAAEDDLSPGEVSGIVDLPRLERGDDWLFLDSCWVHLPEVQRLLDDTLAPARVFAEADDRRLVAYLAATDAVTTPEEAHARCMSRLADHPAAIAPRHYVLCHEAPTTPHDPSSWQRQPVLTEGPGRRTHHPLAASPSTT
ncbi:condensation domain-containing protein [Saccharothrix variisporea]|uniref:Condensation domain-containing protein n=1 Tax=Saccharothrix variisporea TaxID=543527 RepID=A0A495XP58_9PSEU|nr:condensation domain-containing protein [Saccharothrix variisporea]RKT74684.1 condensation domain-containing protein [Saccharothrix variisporea]